MYDLYIGPINYFTSTVRPLHLRDQHQCSDERWSSARWRSWSGGGPRLPYDVLPAGHGDHPSDLTRPPASTGLEFRLWRNIIVPRLLPIILVLVVIAAAAHGDLTSTAMGAFNASGRLHWRSTCGRRRSSPATGGVGTRRDRLDGALAMWSCDRHVLRSARGTEEASECPPHQRQSRRFRWAGSRDPRARRKVQGWTMSSTPC